ncbi:hypothetical protein ITP53_37920 [Nonomuraea sp. K274]|uniref:Uncharacterized protein n=1 Tax=Nonomuraea cypriaca TaxID=1187855 RepID=A0A931AEB0_9ACTN|nr:hypothetical protein [Nonomuraea cypriaca]MBF8191382.1 hypothetical protein [Nonomuraea cypriaca]
MTEFVVGSRSRAEKGLEVVIDRPDGGKALTSGGPSLVEVLDLVSALSTLLDVVNVGWKIYETIVEARSSPGQRTIPHRAAEDLYILIADKEDLRQSVEGVVQRRDLDLASIRLRHVSMNSPLTMELVTSGVSGADVISTVVYLFKHPDRISAWLPKLQTSWYDGRAEAEKAKKAYEKLRKARTEMRELDR